MALSCPDCGNTLTVERYSGVEIEDCGKCGGIWLDAGELKRLLDDPAALRAAESENVPSVTREESANPDRRCPKCNAVLESFHYAYHTPVVLDSCISCSGIWVQDGELANIEEYLRREKRPLSEHEQAAIGAAESIAEHDRFIDRQTRWTGLFNFLRRRPTDLRPFA